MILYMQKNWSATVSRTSKHRLWTILWTAFKKITLSNQISHKHEIKKKKKAPRHVLADINLFWMYTTSCACRCQPLLNIQLIAMVPQSKKSNRSLEFHIFIPGDSINQTIAKKPWSNISVLFPLRWVRG